jgi:hypothetical protein
LIDDLILNDNNAPLGEMFVGQAEHLVNRPIDLDTTFTSHRDILVHASFG